MIALPDWSTVELKLDFFSLCRFTNMLNLLVNVSGLSGLGVVLMKNNVEWFAVRNTLGLPLNPLSDLVFFDFLELGIGKFASHSLGFSHSFFQERGVFTVNILRTTRHRMLFPPFHLGLMHKGPFESWKWSLVELLNLLLTRFFLLPRSNAEVYDRHHHCCHPDYIWTYHFLRRHFKLANMTFSKKILIFKGNNLKKN